MATRKQVILGGGAAGLNAIMAMREVDQDSPITLITGESGLPYARMALPYYLSGKVAKKDLYPMTRSQLDGLKINALYGKPVVDIDLKNKLVRLRGQDSPITFDNLLIATGSVPDEINIPGADLPGVLNMWTLEDVLEIRKRAKSAKKIVVWGAGMVAFLAAKALAKEGRQVYLICRAARILRRSLDEAAAQLMEERMKKFGIIAMKDTNIAAIAAISSNKLKVILTNGEELVVNLVVKGLGVKPNLDFLSVPNWKNGIPVNNCQETEVPGVFAAGDVAMVNDCVTGEPILPALWTTAVKEGRAAGFNMVGKKYECARALPVNILDFHGYSAVSIGCALIEENVRIKTYENKEKAWYRRLVFKGDCLVGAILVGQISDTGVLPTLIRRQVNLRPFKVAIEENPWNLADVFLSQPVYHGLVGGVNA